MGHARPARQLMAAHPLDAAATVPDLAAVFAAYAERSAAARARHAAQCDLAYGNDPMERLDFFDAGPGAPLTAFIHGGYWRRLDKGDFSYIADGLIPHGVSFASINYALAPQTPLAEIVAQCRRAVAWLSANAKQLGFDAQRITVVGHSAGGHLAAMAAVAHPVHAVVSLSGLHDLIPVQQSFVNEWIALDEATARALSPIAHPPARPCLVYATAGERESDAFHAQGRALVDAWRPYGCAAVYEDSPGDNHFTICDRLGRPDDPLTRRIAGLASE
jgi:arylformamidase